jgi:hypothetical protein
MSNPEILKNALLEKNTTFLMGAGASAPFFSSLGNFEKILTNSSISEAGAGLIKIIFYKKSIYDNSYLLKYISGVCYCGEKAEQMEQILDQYLNFIHNNLEFLKVRNSRVSPKRINFLTTNYDLFPEAAIDTILESNPRIYFNDGANGFSKRIFSTDNFNKTLLYSGIMDNYSNEMPVINLIKCHGSINWKKNRSEPTKKERILVQNTSEQTEKINKMIDTCLIDFEKTIEATKLVKNLECFFEKLNEKVINEEIIDLINSLSEHIQKQIFQIVRELQNLEIVFPTKKKFQTTLIEEQFFNMLRFLSYELEKDQSVLICFGFSFYDEHITDIVQRSLNNPNLIIIIMCYSTGSKEDIISRFNFSESSIPINMVFVEPNDFLIDVIDKKDFDPSNKDTEGRKVIDKDGYLYVYSKEISIKRSKENQEFAVLDFAAFNQIIGNEISNKYLSPFKKKDDKENE